MAAQLLSTSGLEKPYVSYAVAADYVMLSVYLLVLLISVTAYRARSSPTRASNVVLVMPSVATRSVKDSLLYAISHNRFLGLPMYVVIDEGAELEDELKRLSGVNVVVVPKDYRRDLIGKGRALRYFVENYVRPDVWYVFLDDDNLVLDDKFLYEIPYYERKGYVAFNPVLVPRQGRSPIAFVMDFARYLDDISFFRFFTGLLKRPYLGLHGELLGVKGSALLALDAFNEPSKVEDYRLAIKIVRSGLKTWQSATRVSILSPNSVRDLIRQRTRWHSGIFESWRDAPASMKAAMVLKSIVRTVGMLGIWLLVPVTHSLLFALLALPTSAAYWYVYFYGAKAARKLKLIVTIPAFWLIEGLGFFYGLLKVGSRDFVVIDKRL